MVLFCSFCRLMALVPMENSSDILLNISCVFTKESKSCRFEETWGWVNDQQTGQTLSFLSCLSLRGSLVLQNECKHQDALLLCSTSSSRYDTYRQTAAQTDRPQKPSACGETLRSTCCCSGGETERKRETDRTGASVMSCEIQLYTYYSSAAFSDATNNWQNTGITFNNSTKSAQRVK